MYPPGSSGNDLKGRTFQCRRTLFYFLGSAESSEDSRALQKINQLEPKMEFSRFWDNRRPFWSFHIRYILGCPLPPSGKRRLGLGWPTQDIIVPSLKLTQHLKTRVGRLVSFGDGLFSGAILCYFSFRECGHLWMSLKNSRAHPFTPLRSPNVISKRLRFQSALRFWEKKGQGKAGRSHKRSSK